MTREEALTELYSLLAKPQETEVSGSPVAVVTADPARPGAENPETNRTSTRVADQLALITQQLDLLRVSQPAQTDPVAENTKAASASTASRVGSAASAASGGAASLLGGFGLSPIVSGLLKLFGGGSDAALPPALTPYTAPSARQVDAGITDGQLRAVDRGSSDRVRALPQITVQVNAMDSKSFMDRSDDIARAVRQAMLESHSINDVVSEL